MAPSRSRESIEKGKPYKWSHPTSFDKEVAVDGIPNATIIGKQKGGISDDTMKISGKAVQTIDDGALS